MGSLFSTASSSSPLAKQVEITVGTNTKLREEFDTLFAEMEFRCKRAAIMNYHEAAQYEKWSDRLQMISTVIGALGLSGIGVSVVQTSKVGASKAGVAGLLALPVCGFLQFLTHGSSSIAPTLAQKAELHVKASAGWQRIGRLTHAYRTQIRHMPPGSDADPILIPSLYRELVEACEEVSKITTVRSDTCDYFSKADNVYTVLNTRKSTLKRFEELEAGAAEPNSTHP